MTQHTDHQEMSCQELVELVTDYLDGVLDPGAHERFERHIDLCSGCEVYLRQMKETATRLGSIPADTLTAEAQAALLAAFREFRR